MRYAELPKVRETERVVSLDALRGFNFIWILGAEGMTLGLAEIINDKAPALKSVGQILAAQISHAPWEGFRFYDLIFPLFIFITGAAIALSLPRLVMREGREKALVHILRRAFVLYILGIIFYGGISPHWSDVRYVGVLQRIALCYLFTSLLFLYFDWRGLVTVSIALLAGYWALMALVPVPGIGAGSYAPDANLANWIDAHYLPGRLWDKTRDPEGLLSTLPAIVSCVIGALAGLSLQRDGITPQRKAIDLVVAGLLMLLAGELWSLQFPIIKAIWTSSFVLVAAGYSAILFGVFYQIIDVWRFSRWATVFVWIGANAITLYFLNNIMSFERLAVRFVGGDFGTLLDRNIAQGIGYFIAHGLGLLFAITLAGYLYRRKIFLRV